MRKLTIFTDGACKGNPGDAGIGVVITSEAGEVVCEVGDYIGRTTNNVAEYSALIRGLKEALSLEADEVELSMDSELMARQITGVYKVKSPNLQPLHAEAIALLRRFRRVSVTHVLRAFNSRADELANEGVKKHRKQLAKVPVSLPAPKPRKTPTQKELEF
jgi:ribonuclease HI